MTKPGWVRPPMPKSADRISGVLDKTTGITTHTCSSRKTGKRWRLDLLTRMTSVGLEVKPLWVPEKE